MNKSRIFDIKGKIPERASIAFLSAELPDQQDIPFALIHYAIASKKQEWGLRLDLDKRIFLDHFDDDAEKEAALQESAPEIVKIVGSMLYSD